MAERRILVVGGGAAGMMAALFAARAGGQVTILERNEKTGKKVYITGKGRCNVTNNAPREEFLQNIVRNPRFMMSALSTLDNFDLMALIESLGTPLKEERGGRVFPVSDRSSDITGALMRGLSAAGVRVETAARVADVQFSDGRVSGVITEEGRVFSGDAVILATGGVSYPATGSTGDGLRLAERTGHRVVAPLPALVPIETKETWPIKLMGLTLKNVTLTAYAEKNGKPRKIYSEMGEMLFTHFGVSGPLALTLSSLLPEAPAGVRMEIDLKPALDEKTLEARLLRDFQTFSRKQISYVMDGLEPHNLGLAILTLAGISAGQPINGVTTQMRKRLIALIKALPLTVKGTRDFSEAIITRGGVNVKDINPSTMESKLVPGLYFAGEMIDVDAFTGGFNLQIAFSTGALAGQSAARMEV